LQDAFGLSTEFVWFENYVSLLQTPEYYHAIAITLVFSALVAFSRSASTCCCGHGQSQHPRRQIYRTFLIVPMRGPAVASVLFIFMFQPGLDMIARALRRATASTGIQCNGTHAMILVVIVAVWDQISYISCFPRRPAGDSADRSRRDRRRAADAAFSGHHLPVAVADGVLSDHRRASPMFSSTRSASSTPRPAAGPTAPRKRWSGVQDGARSAPISAARPRGQSS
jgi:hypothetical protein